MPKTVEKLLVPGVLAALAGTASAQTVPPPAAKPSAAPCTAPERHQLDFWIGEWNVFDTAKGYQVGTSRIEPVMNSCAIKESYEAPTAPAGPYSGTSYSAFDAKDGKWHQFYVDVNGNATWYGGGLVGRDMALSAAGKNGALQRMTYWPLGDGSVEQIGKFSSDGGKNWQPGYDYTYRRK